MDTTGLWAVELDAAVSEQQQETTLQPHEWTASGRSSKDYPNREDWDWWVDHGPAMLSRYEEWRGGDDLNDPWEIWTTPDGQQAIELGLTVPWGTTKLQCHIDRVFLHPFDAGQLVVVDIKSGSHLPPSDRQLGRYASAIEVEYGVRPLYGGYYMARSGLCVLHRLDRPQLTLSYLVEVSERIETAFEQGLFVANPSNLCASCPVRNHCIERN